MGTYPGYDGDLVPSGIVMVEFFDDNAFKFYVSVKGVELNCTEWCGVHIHAGTTCEDAALVGGHFWNTEVYGMDDPWTFNNGASYVSDAGGNVEGYFYLDSGYGFDDHIDHAVVVHTDRGTRISCGTLSITDDDEINYVILPSA
jgi:Cu/Zn superoxide dismutase